MCENNEHPSEQKKSLFPYIVIAVLSVSLLALGAVTFACLDRLTRLQAKVVEMQETVQEITEASQSLIQKSEQLDSLIDDEVKLRLSQEGGSVPNGTQQQNAPQEEGMLSPSKGSGSFSDSEGSGEADESLDNLLFQVQSLLPQDNGSWSVYVCNLAKGTSGSINNQPMQAASLIKLYIMGAVYENYSSLTQEYNAEELDSYLRSMITVSDNDAANALVDCLGRGDSQAGMNVVNDFCQNHGYESTSMGRLLLQSNENGDNYTSVNDCGKFLREIYQSSQGTAGENALVNADAMFSLLKQQERRNKIPAIMPDGVHVANKTGELDTVENDVGIIYDTSGVDLVICFMSQNLTDAGAAQASIAQNSRAIYGYYNEQ